MAKTPTPNSSNSYPSIHTFSLTDTTSSSLFSFKTEAMNANHRCKSKRNSLAFQWDQNRYDRSYELRDIPYLVKAVLRVRKCKYEYEFLFLFHAFSHMHHCYMSKMSLN